ncbi:MAG: hypothetical protein WAN89_06435 [Lawsonella sp.]|nr:hypothetical protein [Mycobacteriales bacterium]
MPLFNRRIGEKHRNLAEKNRFWGGLEKYFEKLLQQVRDSPTWAVVHLLFSNPDLGRANKILLLLSNKFCL